MEGIRHGCFLRHAKHTPASCDATTSCYGDAVCPAVIHHSVKLYSFIASLESYKGLTSIEEVAEVLSVSKFTVYRMAQRKQLPSLVIGGSRKFDPAALAMHFTGRSLLRVQRLPGL